MDNWLYRFDLEERTWSILSKTQENAPSPRLSPAMMVEKSRVFVYGGITSLPLGVFFDDLYSFDTETLTWTMWFEADDRQVALTFVGRVLSADMHKIFAMYSVSDLNTLTSRELPKERESSGLFMQDLLTSYDWNTLVVPPCSAPSNCLSMRFSADLCSRAWMPCHLHLRASASPPAQPAALILVDDAHLFCDARAGCTGITLEGVNLMCTGSRKGTDAALRMVGVGAHLELTRSLIEGCSNQDDGGSIQLYGGSTGSLTGIHFLQSSSAGRGGAIMLQGSTMSLVGCTFEDCRSNDGGGALFLRSELSQLLSFLAPLCLSFVSQVPAGRLLPNSYVSASSSGRLIAILVKLGRTWWSVVLRERLVCDDQEKSLRQQHCRKGWRRLVLADNQCSSGRQ